MDQASARVGRPVPAPAGSLNDQQIGNTLKLLGLKTRRYGASNRKHVEYDADTVESLARDRL